MEVSEAGIKTKSFSSPEEELSYLRSKIAEKEKALADLGHHEATHEAAHQTVTEYKAVAPKDVLHPEYQMRESALSALKLEIESDEHDEKMTELLRLLDEKGVKNTLTLVERMESPHIEDDFHRLLIQYLKAGYPVSGLQEKMPLFRALSMTLYEIVLPAPREDDKNKGLKELLSVMEQLYAGLLPQKKDKDRKDEHFTVELAVQHIGQHVSFFCCVPDIRRGLFEKQVLSLFPEAKIEEVKNDYNIFNDQGVSLGSIAQTSRESIFPIKIYEDFDQDPLSVVLNAFSRFAHEGEGAALQFVVKHSPDDLTKRYTIAVNKIEKGEEVKDAINFSIGKEFLKTTKELFSRVKAEKEETDQQKTMTEIGSLAVEQIKNKIAAPISLVNIRLVVSAPTELRAKELITIIESAFSQFENTHGNKISFKRLTDRKLRHLFHQYSYRQFSPSYEIPLNLKELTTLIHFPVKGLEGAREMKEAKANTGPAPVDIPTSGLLMGRNVHRGSEADIYMSAEDRVRHMYVIGQTGTGKTTLLTNMIVQDIQNGEGCCFIDPHGSDIQYILSTVPKERYEDVIYFDPSNLERPMGFNMLEYDPAYPEQKTFVVNELLGIFNKLFDMKTAGGPMFEKYFRTATMLVMEDPASGNTLLDISRFLTDPAFRKLKISRSKNYPLVQSWENEAEKAGGEASLQNIVPYITSKFDVFISNDIMRPIIAQEKSAFNFRDVMDNKKILLVNLSKGRLGDINANLIGLILVGKILMAALSRVDSFGKDLPPFYLYIDEFQNVTTDSISTILSEARKYKLSLNIAHQFIKQLEEGIRDSVFGNVGSIAAFRVGAEDAEFLEKQFAPVFEARDIMNIDNYNYYAKFLMKGQPTKPFSVKALAPVEGDSSNLQQLKQLSYLKYGRPLAEIEEEIRAKYQSKEAERPQLSNPFL